MINLKRTICFLFYLSCACLISCASSGPEQFLKRTNSEADDQIMFVRRTPATFGFQRLAALADTHQDLGYFIGQNDIPSFIAETGRNGNRYVILYYLEERETYACRINSSGSQKVEFSGPYPITDGEAKTLKTLKNRSKPLPID